nr:MAG TPA: hypothetical protein [Crassvirales sp.]
MLAGCCHQNTKYFRLFKSLNLLKFSHNFD